jgi:hypothetical protein
VTLPVSLFIVSLALMESAFGAISWESGWSSSVV